MDQEYNIVFLGTPLFAAAHLHALIEAGENVVGVISRPDKPKGRGRKLLPTPVKQVAIDNNVDIIQPPDPGSDDMMKWIKDKNPQLMITVAYGRILPPEILDLPAGGAWNIHTSLLPRWRGASPITRAVQSGDAKTGITLMLMAKGLDTGDILLQAETEIGPDETMGELESRLKKIGCDLLIGSVKNARNGKLHPTPQPDEGATYAPLIKKEETVIDWKRSKDKLHNHIRAFSPSPGARCGELKILRSRRIDGVLTGAPGSISEIGRSGIAVNTGDGLLMVTELQPPGKKPMNAADYARGKRLKQGDVI